MLQEVVRSVWTQISEDLLPIYRQAAEELGNFAVRKIAQPGEEFYFSSIDSMTGQPIYRKATVTDDCVAVQISCAGLSTSPLHRRIQELSDQQSTNNQ